MSLSSRHRCGVGQCGVGIVFQFVGGLIQFVLPSSFAAYFNSHMILNLTLFRSQLGVVVVKFSSCGGFLFQFDGGSNGWAVIGWIKLLGPCCAKFYLMGRMAGPECVGMNGWAGMRCNEWLGWDGLD